MEDCRGLYQTPIAAGHLKSEDAAERSMALRVRKSSRHSRPLLQAQLSSSSKGHEDLSWIRFDRVNWYRPDSSPPTGWWLETRTDHWASRACQSVHGVGRSSAQTSSAPAIWSVRVGRVTYQPRQTTWDSHGRDARRPDVKRKLASRTRGSHRTRSEPRRAVMTLRRNL